MSVPRHKKLKHELNRNNDVIFLNSVWESERKEHSLLVPATFLHGGTRYFLSTRTLTSTISDCFIFTSCKSESYNKWNHIALFILQISVFKFIFRTSWCNLSYSECLRFESADNTGNHSRLWASFLFTWETSSTAHSIDFWSNAKIQAFSSPTNL
jgi:hypothetical protein